LISSEDNIKNLDKIQKEHIELGDPRKTPPARARELIKHTPGIAWMMYNVHGGELSGTDAGLALAYNLASAKNRETLNILDNTVIIMDPCQNPDGRERGLASLSQWSGKTGSSDTQSMSHRGTWPGSRANHYLFDMNRDWFILSQPETRARVKAMLHWNPQLVVDAHEMGSSSTYFFNPPREPVSPHINPAIISWWDVFSKDQAEAFDKMGWSYFTNDAFDEWYPGYGSSWAFTMGAVGILYEQASTGGTSVKQPGGQELSFQSAVHHHYLSSITNIKTASIHKEKLLGDFYKMRQEAVSLPGNAPVKTYYLLAGKDPARTGSLIERLTAQGIEVLQTAETTTISNVKNYWQNTFVKKTFPAGTYVIRMDQPLSPLITAIMEFDVRLNNRLLAAERKSIEEGKGTRMYEVGAWCMPMAFGVDAYISPRMVNVKTRPVEYGFEADGQVINPSPRYGFIIDYANSRAMSALIQLYRENFKVRAAKKPFTVEGHPFSRGSLLIRLHENPLSLPKRIAAIARQNHLTIYGTDTGLTEKGPDLGGSTFELLKAPRVGIMTGAGISSTGFGSLWFMLDTELKLSHSLLNINSFSRTDLRKYNVLILPSASSYKSLLGKRGLKNLKNWITNGGTLIGLDRAASFLSDSSTGLIAVRERSSVLKKLSLYEKALNDEKMAGKMHIDSLAIWEGSQTIPTSPIKKDKKTAYKELLRLDKQQKRLYPRGVILRLDINPEHWLGFGLDHKIPALAYTSNAYLSRSPVETAARYSEVKKLRLSGLFWPEAKPRWANSTYAARQQSGNGQVIFFAGDTNYRSYFYGTARMLKNAILLGPGLGTRQPIKF